MRNHSLGVAGLVGLGVAVASAVVACGSDFGGADCRATRTCPPEDGDAGAGAQGGGGTDDGGHAPAEGGGDAAGDAEGGMSGAEAGSSNAAPEVTSVTPKSDAPNVEPDAVVTLVFSEPLAADSVTETSVKLLDGDVTVPGSVKYAYGQVTFTPENALTLLATYTVVVSGVTDVAGAPLASDFESKFRVRDGQFTTIDAVKKRPFQLSQSLPMNARGDVLLAWTDYGQGSYCPPLAQWFHGGMALDASPRALAAPDVSECNSVASGANAAGIAAVAWEVPDAQHGAYVQQFRDGKWGTADGKVSSSMTANRFRIAVAPNGSVSFFDSGGPGPRVYRSDETGKWAAAPDVLSTNATAVVEPEVAFDAAGNGLAVWRARTSANVEQISYSRFTAKSGKWATAALVPGSLASAAGTTYERGAPALAMDASGDAVVLWVSRDGASASEALMASHLGIGGSWESLGELAPNLLARPTYDPPGLVFDGSEFVAAFTASDGETLGTYTARYDSKRGKWTAPEPRQAAGDAAAVTRMPRLVGDQRGNLILVWATGAGPTFDLVYQRYADEAWSDTTPVPGGSVANEYFAASNYPLPLTMSDNGMAALAWGSSDLAKVRLASFF